MALAFLTMHTYRTSGLVSEYAIPRDRNNSVAKEIRLKLKNKEEILRQIDEEVISLFTQTYTLT